MVTDQRNKRDHHAAVISNHLEGNLPIILGLCFGFFFCCCGLFKVFQNIILLVLENVFLELCTYSVHTIVIYFMYCGSC